MTVRLPLPESQAFSMTTSSALLTCQRAAFDLPESICWLNSAYMSPLLHEVARAGQQGVSLRGQPWKISADDFFEPAEELRALFAGLINADADGIALVPSVSYAVGIATANLPISRGQNLVVVEEQFPSNIYPWREIARTKAATVRTVSIPDEDWTTAIIAQIDDQTAVVSIPHVHWTTGAQFGIDRIADHARQMGAALVVDATQSLGTLPLNTSVIQPDFLIAAAYKCLLGPYGLTYLYVAPRWRQGRPLEEGWLNRQNAADFSQLTEYCDDYVSGARRYDFGERASTILLPMAIAALRQISEWTIPRIEQYTRPLIQYIVSRADEAGLKHTSAQEASPCMIGIQLPGNSPNDLGRQLAERNIYVSIRRQNARIAAHVYNSTDDVDRLFEALRRLSG